MFDNFIDIFNSDIKVISLLVAASNGLEIETQTKIYNKGIQIFFSLIVLKDIDFALTNFKHVGNGKSAGQ